MLKQLQTVLRTHIRGQALETLGIFFLRKPRLPFFHMRVERVSIVGVTLSLGGARKCALAAILENVFIHMSPKWSV